MLLCIGTTPTVQRTLTFDRLRLNEVNRAASCDEYASGKSVNVARVAALLGEPVVATGFIGGIRGTFLQEGLTRDLVRHDFVKAATPTRLCTTVIDRAKQTVTELVEESQPVELRDWVYLIRKSFKHLGTATACVLSGSLPPDGDLEFYPDVIYQAGEKDVPVVLDTRGKPLLSALRSQRFVAKLNREELSQTVGRPLRGDGPLKRAMQEICPVGGTVVITLGSDGAVVWDAEKFWRIPAPKVKVINPIGSGDSFAAGLAVGLARKLPPKERYALASACGAANAMTQRAGVVRPGDVERLAKRVRVVEW